MINIVSRVFILMLPLLVLFVLIYGDRNLEEIIIKKTEEKKAMEIVKNLLKSGTSIEIISYATNLTPEQIEELKSS